MKKHFIILNIFLLFIVLDLQAQDACCPDTPTSNNILYAEVSSSPYNIRFADLKVHDNNTGSSYNKTFPTSGTLELLRIPQGKGITFTVQYEKRSDGKSSGKYLDVYDYSGNKTNINSLTYDEGCTGNWTRCFKYFNDGTLLQFNDIGTYKIEALVTYDRYLASTETLEISFWVCVYPDDSYPFPSLTANPVFVDQVCNGSQLGVSGNELDPLFTYGYRYNTNDFENLPNTSSNAIIYSSGPGQAYLTIKNLCTGNLSNEEKAIALDPHFAPTATLLPQGDGIIGDPAKTVTMCQGGELLINSVVGASEGYYVSSYQWEYRSGGGSFTPLDGEIGTQLFHGPNETSTWLNTGWINEHEVRLVVKDTFGINGCANTAFPSVPDQWNIKIIAPPDVPAITLQPDKLRIDDVVDATVSPISNSNVITWGDGQQSHVISSDTYSHRYNSPGIYNLIYRVDNGACFKEAYAALTVYKPLCSVVKPLGDSYVEFKEDDLTGAIMLDLGICKGPIVFTCLSGQSQIDEIVATSATTFSDEHEVTEEFRYDWNQYEIGHRGKYRPLSSYTFNTSVQYYDNNDLNNPKLNKTAGTFPYSFFNYQSEGTSSSSWLNANTITKYSVNGEPVEEVNALGIPSTAHFGYNDAVPVLTAQNAAYDEVYFEGFEYNISKNLQQVYVHSGKNALRLTSQGIIIPTMPVTEHIKEVGMILQFWVNIPALSSEDEILNSITGSVKINNQIQPIAKKIIVGQSSGWFLMEFTLDNTLFATGADFLVEIKNGTLENVFLDDIRLQPFDSQMSTYVYDNANLRLLAVFDDRNFGMFYQYDEEGRLIRKKIETVEGAKTIQETFYNVPGEPYNNE